jgi:hypothetical protein
MNGGGAWKEVAAACFKTLSHNLHDETEKNNEQP